MIPGEQDVDSTAEGPDWLSIARDSFQSSTDYLDANWRKQMERNIALFQSRHPDGSKYNSAAYKHRSRLFRPKTKSVVRKNEAAAAAAFFANVDVVSIEPENDADQAQVASAELMGELVNYRLTKTIPWFVTLLGALQEAQVIGVVASYQYWKYREVEQEEYAPLLDEVGQEIGYQPVTTVKVVEDKPCIELIPFENIRFDPGAAWTDVVGTSPYLIRMVPMYVDDVQSKMRENDPKTGAPKWKTYSEGEIREAMVDYDTMRQQRENKRADPLANTNAPLKRYEIVWCHENFVRIDGEEVVYWTLGTHKMLTDPVPLAEAYFHGERPIVIGCAVLEAHKPVPDALVSMSSELQKEINDTVNQRRDNVSLVLNKRYVVKRNQQVDIESLQRNVPGGVTMANNPTDDVREMNWPDVTSSAYQEQNLLNVDFDELTGNFSQSSISTNRNLNETVGGMQMLGSSANQMTEYLIRTFVETWVEPVLRQLVKLEQAYETDQTILGLAGERAGLAQKYGMSEGLDSMLNADLTVRVNVGMGATDPQQKVGKFLYALKTYAEVMATMPDADPEAIRKEVFGLIGYKDGSRFFKKQDDPAIAQMQQQLQQAMQMMQQMQMELQAVKASKEAEMMKATSDAGLKMAQMDLTEAQTAKTIVEANMIPSQQMAQRATNVA
jgi:hypothetical protein